MIVVPAVLAAGTIPVRRAGSGGTVEWVQQYRPRRGG